LFSLLCFFYQYWDYIQSSPPSKGDFIDILSMDCHVQLIPIRSLYIFNILIHPFLNTSNLFYSTSETYGDRYIEPDPYSLGSIFHLHPNVLSTWNSINHFPLWNDWLATNCPDRFFLWEKYS
jgi:hypothetical protein